MFAAVEPRAALTLGPALQHRQESIHGAWTPRGALHRPGPELRPSAAHDLRRRRPSAATPAIPRLGKSQPVSRMLLHHSLYHVGHPSSGNTPAGEAPPRRAAVVLAGAAQSPTEPRNHHRWFTHGAKTLLDPSAGPISPQNAGLEEVRRCAAAELQSLATCAAAVAPLQPEPPDLEATV